MLLPIYGGSGITVRDGTGTACFYESFQDARCAARYAAGVTPIAVFECNRHMRLAAKPCQGGDFGGAGTGLAQQQARCCNPSAHQIVMRRLPDRRLERAQKEPRREPASRRHVAECERVAEPCLDQLLDDFQPPGVSERAEGRPSFVPSRQIRPRPAMTPAPIRSRRHPLGRKAACRRKAWAARTLARCTWPVNCLAAAAPPSSPPPRAARRSGLPVSVRYSPPLRCLREHRTARRREGQTVRSGVKRPHAVGAEGVHAALAFERKSDNRLRGV